MVDEADFVGADWPSIDAYLICATPRTGSTLLCDLLRWTEIAGRPESYFRLPDEQALADRWQLARGGAGTFNYGHYVRAAVAGGTSPGARMARHSRYQRDLDAGRRVHMVS
jgi:trehalose 2-sulfotransferase